MVTVNMWTRSTCARASRGWNKGYPGRYGKGHKIVGLDEIEKGVVVYFAGVDEDPHKGLVTYGGRVLHVIAGSPTLEEAREKAIFSGIPEG